MKCCVNCFKDTELKSIIKAISTDIGDCDYCYSKSISIVDVKELGESFNPIVSLYKVDDTSPHTISEIIQQEWDIFNCNNDTIKKILSEMFPDKDSFEIDLFEKPANNVYKSSGASSNLLDQWNLLKQEIKYKNRFFLQNIIDLDLLNELLEDQTKCYVANKVSFFRGRISKDVKGFNKDQLGKPPMEYTTAGRANPIGIPYLYLSVDEKTTLYETRSTYLDFVTIGEFVLKENIKIVCLRAIGQKSPFIIQNLDKYYQYQPFLIELEKELSKPLRRYDLDLDYLPTQYLCEFIKSRNFDGVEFGSAMNKNGVNLAIFNDSKFECIKTKVVEIKNIEITY